MEANTVTGELSFLRGGGEMGELIRNYDWEKTSLGVPDNWPLTLQNIVGIVLHAASPQFLFWGKDLLSFYNDSFRPSLGIDGKHPAIGKKAKDTWPEIWDLIGPLIENVMSTGEAVFFEDQLVPFFRNGKIEDIYWTFSYSPAYGDDGKIAGVFVTCIETTSKVKAMASVHETKNQMQFAIEAAELGTWELNPMTNKFTGNTRLKEWFGLQPGEEIELSLATSVIAEKDKARVNEAISKALTYESGGIYDIEYLVQNPVTGIETIVKAKGKAYFNEEKQPYTFNGTLQDVTHEANTRKQLARELIEQKLVRKKVEESEAHLQLLRNSVPAMLFYADSEQRYQSYNEVFMDWFKVNATEAIGKTIREFIGETAYGIASPYLDRAYSGEQVRYQVHAPSRMNLGKWLDIVYTPHLNAEGKVIGVFIHAMDITQSKQTELSLRNSEVRFRSLIEDAPVATCLLTGREMKIEIANEIMLGFWGKDRSVIGMRLEEAIPELKGQPFFDILNKVFTTGKAYNETASEARLKVNGVLETYYFNYTYKPLFNDIGEVYGIMNMAIDVTEQILAQKRIQESDLFARDVIYNSPIAKIVYTGEEMVVSMVNENMLRLIGRDNSIIGKRFTEVIPELAGSIIEESMKNAYFTGEMSSQEETQIELIRFGKPYLGYYNYVYKALRNVSGNIYGIMATATEITQQVVARKIIEGKEKELRDLISAAPIGICVLQGIEARIVEANERFITISGKKREQFLNATYWEVFPEVAAPFAPILENVFKTGIKFTTAEAEMVLIRHGVPEKIFTTFEYLPVFDINNAVTKIIVLVIEVTHQVEIRKEIEKAVIERTKELAETNLNLKRSNAELEQFAYIASHDLQEPVRKISTFTQMLEHSIPEMTQKSKDYFTKIYSSTDRMTNLIRDVLAFSTIAQATETFEAVDLTKTIDIVKAEFELQIEKKEASVEVANLPVIHGSAMQMSQLFGNLLSNSLKFTMPGIKPVIKISGAVATKETVAKHPTLDAGKKYYLIQFSDNGIGFDEENAEKIFRIFQRLHGKKEFEGTGIGLSICKKIVQSHDGHIAAAQGENGGALFNILLPELTFKHS
ncbi:MAG: PAS domain-containing protein [Ferruginibacter sp.]